MMAPQPPTRTQTALATVAVLVHAVVAYVATMPVLVASLVTSTVASWWFLITYVTSTRWEAHVTGRNMVMLSGSLTGLLTLAVLAPLAPDLAYYLGTFLYAGLTVACVWLVRTLRRVQREKDDPLLDRSVATPGEGTTPRQ